MVRKLLTTLYIDGRGDNIRYISSGNSSSDALFSSGGSNRIRGISNSDKYTGKGLDKYKDRLYNYFWYSSRRYRYS